jgi:nitroreductase
MTNIIDSLKWRYSTQVYDPSKKLSQTQLDTILEAARLAPSSYGLQPWRFIVVNDQATRAKLREAGYGQPKITDASHLVVIAVQEVTNEATVDEYMKSVAETRKVSLESLAGYKGMIMNVVNSMTPEQLINWSTRQAYLALGVIIAAASLEGVDSGPMEGFEPAKFDEILGLKKLGLQSKVAIALGFRSDSDKMAKAAKVRYPKSKVVVEMN